MSSVLPVIEMPEKEPELPQQQEIPDNKLRTATDSVALAEQAGNMELIDQLMEEKEDDFKEDDIINIEEREIPEEEEVFTDPPPPKVAPVLEEDEPPNEFTQKKGKRKYTRKAPMSDKQKAHLAKIRQIAVEKRKAEKERKLKEKEEAVIAKAEKKILDKKKKEEEQAQADQQKPKEKPQAVIQQNGFTKDDLDNAVLSAISQYDTLRKQRKKEKIEKQSKQREEDKMRATLARAIQPQQKTAPDPWRSLFS